MSLYETWYTGFSHFLEHTPVHAMGINRLFGYRLESQRELRNICNKFMPVADWKAILNNPETVSLIIREERNTSVQGRRQIKIGPSVGYDPGLYVEVNDHYDNPVSDKEPPTAYPLMDVLERQWKESTDRAYEIAEQIISLGRSSR